MKVGSVLGGLAVTVLVLSSCATTVTGRIVAWGPPNNEHYQEFPQQPIANAPPVFRFQNSSEAEERFASLFGPVSYTLAQEPITAQLETLLEETGTTGFIVIQDDTILYEKYFNGYARDSINTSASVAKSITSALVGVAFDEGYLEDIRDPITRYLPEMDAEGYARITLWHLLTMSSGLEHTWVYMPWGDVVRSLYAPDVRKVALGSEIAEEPGLHFWYNNCHAQLLGIILERVTGRSVSEYLEEKLWRPLGMEFPASWSLDSEQNGFELMMYGFNARAIDYAKFGRLYLNQGMWQGKRIISEEWIVRTTAPVEELEAVAGYYDLATEEPEASYFHKDTGYYSHKWWGYRTGADDYDFFARGILGQYIYVAPRKKVIIVRTSERIGDIDWWPAVFRDLVNRL